MSLSGIFGFGTVEVAFPLSFPARSNKLSRIGCIALFTADKEKKLIVTIRKGDLAKDTADARPEVFSKDNALDAKITELDLNNRRIKLSVKAAQIDEEKSLIAKTNYILFSGMLLCGEGSTRLDANHELLHGDCGEAGPGGGPGLPAAPHLALHHAGGLRLGRRRHLPLLPAQLDQLAAGADQLQRDTE